MTYPLTIEPEAKDDLERAYIWYEDRRPGLGRAFLERVEELFDRLRQTPEMHAATYRNVRQTLVKRFPYVVCYTVEAAHVYVIAVFHGHRDPEAWKSRAR